MKGTNPETQGHRWAKRVKKRLKKIQKEDGQWGDLKRKKEREAEEASSAAAGHLQDPTASLAFQEDDLRDATDLRDEKNVEDPAELAAVRAVKAAAAVAAERLARLEREAETKEGVPTTEKKRELQKSHANPTQDHSSVASTNPFAALGALRRARSKHAVVGDARAFVAHPERAHSAASPPHRAKPPPPPGESARDARNRLAAEGAEKAIHRKRVLGVRGVPGSSAKKLKRRLKRALRATRVEG
jgi:hypothetical protein